MLLRFQKFRSAIRMISVLGGAMVVLTTWIVLASSDSAGKRDRSVQHQALWSGAGGGSDESLSFLTHGDWRCPNAECRYRALSGGEPFRSATSQDCSLCKSALVPGHPADPTFAGR